MYHLGATTGLSSLAPYGYLAVDLFFILSGFVIGNAYESKLTSSLSWRAFMLIRIARLYPCLFLGCLLGIAAHPDATIFTLLGQFALIPDFASHELFPLNAVMWSLFFELVINAVHAGCVSRLSIKTLTIFTAVCAVAFATVSWMHGGPGLGWGVSTFWPGFIRVGFGYSLGLLMYRMWASLPLSSIGVSPIITMIVLALLLVSPNLGHTNLQVPLTLFVAFPALVALGVISKPKWGPAMSWLGGLSYPLYATHLPLLILADKAFHVGEGIINLAGIAATIVAVAALLDRFYDAPLRRLLRQSFFRSRTAGQVA